MDEIQNHLARIEREQEEREPASLGADEDEGFLEDPELSAARARSFMLMKRLLLAPQLGTS